TEQQPETDGTAAWSSTTLVLVEIDAAGKRGTGWTYGSAAIAPFIGERLSDVIEGCDALAVRNAWATMNARVRNDVRGGLASYAVAAVDVALWDLRARLLDAPLCDVLGLAREAVPVYGSGGFTSYDVTRLREQLGGWARDGMRAVKMKVGRDPAADPDRVAAARAAIGPAAALFVDANGAYTVEQAVELAAEFHRSGVSWFEQPIDHRDLAGTRFVKEHAPPGMAIASGEYITDTADAPSVAGAVDVLQADATRCGGYTGLLAIDGYCDAARMPLSTHCSPMLHLPVAAASLRVRHMEYFYDHVRIEKMLFDGFIEPVGGMLHPDRSRRGHGLTFKHADAQKFRV
ncbi:MAG: mandelate racemase, partial [Candidatus Eremiobacteraeota bacterium]|nr:mandelate racemase [Candidatus Eremiobacteraeota bacterium]